MLSSPGVMSNPLEIITRQYYKPNEEYEVPSGDLCKLLYKWNPFRYFNFLKNNVNNFQIHMCLYTFLWQGMHYFLVVMN